MNSEMPSYKEMYDQYLMKIIQIPLIKPLSIGVYDSFIDDLSDDTSIKLEVFKIADERVRGWIPNKVWWDDNAQQWVILFYSSQAVAIKDRPLKNNYCCIAMLDSTCYQSIGYHVEAKIVIDQIKGPDNRMFYVFVFNEAATDIIKDNKHVQE